MLIIRILLCHFLRILFGEELLGFHLVGNLGDELLSPGSSSVFSLLSILFFLIGQRLGRLGQRV